MQCPIIRPRPERLALLVFLLGVALMLHLGVRVYGNRQDEAQAAAIRQLEAIADLKSRQIDEWLATRTMAAHAINEVPWLAQDVQRLLANASNSSARASVQSWMGMIQRRDRYRRLVLLDAQPVVCLASPRDATVVGDRARQAARDALRMRQPVLSDLHFSAVSADYVNMDWLVPIACPDDPSAPPIGVFMMEIDPADFLFPVISDWPLPNTTAETLLVRRDGQDVVYLNEVRFRRGTALHLREALRATQQVAVQAVRNRAGSVQGLDYRGRPVLAVTRRLAGAPWFLVAKIDQEEVDAPLHRAALRDGVIGALAALVVGLALLLAWQGRERRYLRGELAMAERMAHLIKHANDAILLFDQDWKIIEANDKAAAMYGYAHDELLHRSIWDLRTEDTWAAFDAVAEHVETIGSVRVETTHRRKDGTRFWVESSLSRLQIDGRRHVQSIIRDVSERKQAEEQIALLQHSIDVHADGAYWFDSQDRLVYVNDAGCRVLGYTREELLGQPLQRINPRATPDTMQQIWGILRKEGHISRETIHLRKDGSAVPIEMMVSYVTFGGREYTCGFAHDITERKRAEAALREKMDLLERFQSVTVDRELQMVELKREINALLRQLGQPERYRISPDIALTDEAGEDHAS